MKKIVFVLLAAALSATAGSPDFITEIRPLLNRKCTGCHGGVKKKGGLSFLIRSEALKKGKSGEIAVKPGHPELSEAIRRIETTDPDEIMPPEGEPLTKEEQQLLRDWVKNGAEWEEHWAYQAPVKHAPPTVTQTDWPRNAIDRFVLAKLEAAGQKPSPEAEPAILLRRASLDLRGVPPTPAETKAFLADTSADAYEKAVDRFLASPKYGERWTGMWLDLARYADTQGYEKDSSRTIWRYRDWLIDAFNDNKPFDQFTIEQLAGDLLPDATMEQKLATAFHRNTMTNTEGGTDDEEFRVAAVIDRVNTTWETWMGTTIACVQCHSHPYDPFKHEEFYQFYAFLNSTADSDKNNEHPTMACPTPEQVRKQSELKRKIAGIQQQLDGDTPERIAAAKAWAQRLATAEARWRPAAYGALQSVNGATLSVTPDNTVLAGGANPDDDVYVIQTKPGVRRLAALRIDALPHPSLPKNGPGRADDGNFVLSGVTARIERGTASPSPMGRYVRIDLPGSQRWLCLAEVQVFSGEQNLAPAGKAKQSSTAYAGPAHYAIDNNTVGAFSLQSVTHTASETNPWWEVDLGKSAPIDRVTVWNRTDGNLHDRLNGAVISVLDDNRNVLWTQTMPLAPKTYKDFHLNGPVEIQFARAVVDYEQNNFGANYLLENPDPKRHGWAVSGQIGQPHYAVLIPDRVLEITEDATVTVTMKHNFHTDVWERYGLGHFRFSFSDEPVIRDFYDLSAKSRAAVVASDGGAYEPQVQNELLAAYRSRNPADEKLLTRKAHLEKELKEIREPMIPVMVELAKPRKTQMFERGNWLALGAEVKPDVPDVMPPLPDGAKGTRLDMAKWLVQPDHPLTGRVIVNRFWEQTFGVGIVKTVEDFGSQGDLPSHPKLLDYLALHFTTDLRWDLKALLREIVTSSVYRQDSAVTAEQLARDPENRMLARGPRFRLSAEQMRDQALAAAGLLSDKMHGPSVMPPQPDGLWSTIYNSEKWITSKGDDRYRRAIYTFWKRTTPYPSMETFDAPARVVCTNRRIRTNTPLQAMVMLNDPVYLEAAQALAANMVAAGDSDAARIEAGFRALLVRAPDANERNILQESLDTFRRQYNAQPEGAKALASSFAAGKSWPQADASAAEVSAWTMLGSVLLNLDEATNRL